MASERGRGAQVKMDGDAQRIARGTFAAKLSDNFAAKVALEAAGAGYDGTTADGSAKGGTAALDEVLTPDGIMPGAVYGPTVGILGDGATDNLAALNAAATGGPKIIVLPAGTFLFSSTVSLPAGVVIDGQGTSTILALTPGKKGHVIASKDFDALTGTRVRAVAAMTPAGGTINLTDVSLCVPAQRFAIVDPAGVYRWRGSVVSVNAAAKTVTLNAGTTSYTAAVGDMIYFLDNAGPAECGVRKCYIRGNRDNTIGVDNVCQPQTRATAGALTLNGINSAVWADGKPRAAFQSNTRLRFESTGDNSARIITIVAPQLLLKNGTIVTVPDISFAGPGAGAASAVYSPLELIGLDPTTGGITVDGAVAGNVWCGFPDGPEAGHGLALFGPRVIAEDVVVQKCRGWGVWKDWGVYGEGWTDTIATQRGSFARVQVFMNDGGGIMLAGAYDEDVHDLVVNQCYHRGIEIGRRGSNMRLSFGHVSAAYENSLRFIRHFEGIHIVGDSATVVGVTSEGASNCEYTALANNITIMEGQPFDPNNGPFRAVERAVGVQVGEVRGGWACIQLRSRIRAYNLSGGTYRFENSGGFNSCEASGYDVSTNFAVTGAAAGNIPAGQEGSFGVGEGVFLRNALGGTELKTILTIGSGTVTFTTGIVLPNPVQMCRGILYAGTPHPSDAVDIRMFNSSQDHIYRRSGAVEMIHPTNGSEFVQGWVQGGGDAFLLNRAASALSIGTNNVEAVRIGARGVTTDVFLTGLGTYPSDAAAGTAGVPPGAIFRLSGTNAITVKS